MGDFRVTSKVRYVIAVRRADQGQSPTELVLNLKLTRPVCVSCLSTQLTLTLESHSQTQRTELESN